MKQDLKVLRALLGGRTPEVIRQVNEFREAHTHLVREVDPVSIGKAFRQLRKDRGISLRGMAKAIGVSAPFLSDVELGQRNLSLYHTVLFLETIKRK